MLTSTGAVFGTPSYMAPEQLHAARNADVPADVWALGAILFELCTCRTPFVAPSLAGLCAAVLTDPSPRLCDHRPDAPAGLETVLLRCLEKKPEQRYPNLVELAQALAPFGTPLSLTSMERITRVLQPERSEQQRIVIVPNPRDRAPEDATTKPLVPDEPTKGLRDSAPDDATTKPLAPADSTRRMREMRRRGAIVLAGLALATAAMLLGGYGAWRHAPAVDVSPPSSGTPAAALSAAPITEPKATGSPLPSAPLPPAEAPAPPASAGTLPPTPTTSSSPPAPALKKPPSPPPPASGPKRVLAKSRHG
jgi:serine/threonine protein kinase